VSPRHDDRNALNSYQIVGETDSEPRNEREKREEKEMEVECFEIRGNNLYGIRPNSESLVTIRLDRRGLYMDTRNI